MAAKFNFRSVRDGCRLGMIMFEPCGYHRLVAEVLMPSDGDWRADVEFYDDLEKAYRTRIRKAIEQYN